MNTANITPGAIMYYATTGPAESEWVIHRRGCDKIGLVPVFLGTLYTDNQASGTALKRFKTVSYCPQCIPSFPT